MTFFQHITRSIIHYYYHSFNISNTITPLDNYNIVLIFFSLSWWADRPQHLRYPSIYTIQSIQPINTDEHSSIYSFQNVGDEWLAEATVDRLTHQHHPLWDREFDSAHNNARSLLYHLPKNDERNPMHRIKWSNMSSGIKPDLRNQSTHE